MRVGLVGNLDALVAQAGEVAAEHGRALVLLDVVVHQAVELDLLVVVQELDVF